MRRVRTDLESVASRSTPAELASMTASRSARTLADDLREVVAALDRRMPRVERASEADIARDSAALKGVALRLLAILQESAIATDAPRDGA